MDKIVKLGQALRNFVDAESPKVTFVVARVIAIDGDVCTVEISGKETLNVEDVRLKPTTGESNKMLITPRIGSHALVVSLSGDFRDLQVVAADEIDKVEIITENMNVEIDIQDGKISIENADTSLIDILVELKNLLQTKYKVFTPAGPSGTALPDTVAALNDFEATFKKLLK